MYYKYESKDTETNIFASNAISVLIGTTAILGALWLLVEFIQYVRSIYPL
jgi:hypothetical protein